jgi:hypothetical protein
MFSLKNVGRAMTLTYGVRRCRYRSQSHPNLERGTAGKIRQNFRRTVMRRRAFPRPGLPDMVAAIFGAG